MADDSTSKRRHEESMRWDEQYVVHIEKSAREYSPEMVVEADGCWLTMADGHRYLDLHGQYMCVGMGHGHPKLKQAIKDALDGVGFVCQLMTHEAKGRAAKRLVEDTMAGEAWAGGVKFVSSGSEAVEAGVLAARVFTHRPLVVSMEASYHGWTPSASAATSLPYLRNIFHDERTGGTVSVPGQPSGPFTIPAPRGDDASSVNWALAEAERIIRELGTQNVAAVMYEIYHGAGGFLVPDAYVRGMRELTRRLGILWIDDEVIAGAGRTGKWWAYQHANVEPDILCTAKGITSSTVPAGAAIYSKEVANYLSGGQWAAISTFSGHPLATAAIAANIEIMNEEGVVEHAASVGEKFGKELARLVELHKCTASLSGRGLAWSIELVKDPSTGERWIPSDRRFTADIDPEPTFWPGQFVVEECKKHDVLLFNFLPNTVTIAPPLKISESELQLAVKALDSAFSALDRKVVSS